MISYFEICELLREYGWSRIWDNEKRIPVIHNGNEWIGYEDSQSLMQKVNRVFEFLNLFAPFKNLLKIMKIQN